MGKEKAGEINEGNITNVYENPDAKPIFRLCLKTEGLRIEACETNLGSDESFVTGTFLTAAWRKKPALTVSHQK